MVFMIYAIMSNGIANENSLKSKLLKYNIGRKRDYKDLNISRG